MIKNFAYIYSIYSFIGLLQFKELMDDVDLIVDKSDQMLHRDYTTDVCVHILLKIPNPSRSHLLLQDT